MSPAAPGTTIISASPSNAGPSGVRSGTSSLRRSAIRYLRGGAGRLGLLRRLGGGDLALLLLRLGRLLRLARHAAALLDRLLDRPDHVERLLGQLVVLAVENLVEAVDRVLELHVLAGLTRELLGDEVRLREEALDLPRAGDDHLVLVGKLVDAEDGDDVLEVLVALEQLLDARRS